MTMYDTLTALIEEHARHPEGTIKVGDRIEQITVTRVGTHTVSYVTDDGWSGGEQIPFVGPWGEPLPALARAQADTAGLHLEPL